MSKRELKHARPTPLQIEEAHEYMRNWIETESWSELQVCLDHEGDTMYAAELLCSAGAINSADLETAGAMCEDAAACERTIEALAREFRAMPPAQQLKHICNTFKDCFIACCDDCNNVSYIADGNEEIYPEVKSWCWECGSKNIRTKRGI
jgi:hypothetical protein